MGLALLAAKDLVGVEIDVVSQTHDCPVLWHSCLAQYCCSTGPLCLTPLFVFVLL